MKFKLELYRAQRRLAVTKFASHPECSPWREKYQDWIRQLDERIVDAGGASMERETVTVIPADSPPTEQAPSSTSEANSFVVTGTTSIPRKQIKLSKPGPPKVVGTVRVRRNASLPHAMVVAGARDEGNALVQGNAQEAAYRKSLLSENELLRKMLERFA
ncbi:hypothetical protein HFO02_09275 [Rhizobium laguerreae]|uniref:hypothetical protein n=1 Tax=Rhizobium laguerreae TaxID=1076926 RepID=UPI001C91FEB8|nr:hypothetical protein [Rhizobium laguerreae]MBY3323801.1 hypothetical protein [Rhizobium laguerreae]